MKQQLKLKEGQKAKVIAKNSGHGFRKGIIVEITELFQDSETPHYECMNIDKTERWFLDDTELKKVGK